MMSQENSDFFMSSSSASEENSRHSTSDSENDASPQSFREDDWRKRTTTDDGLVQIRASTSEVRRRIQAFMDSKRTEVSDHNIREFCFDLPSSVALLPRRSS